ncbi:unnamed protein product, partial [Closterium sp. NIES-53]
MEILSARVEGSGGGRSVSSVSRYISRSALLSTHRLSFHSSRHTPQPRLSPRRLIVSHRRITSASTAALRNLKSITSAATAAAAASASSTAAAGASSHHHHGFARRAYHAELGPPACCIGCSHPLSLCAQGCCCSPAIAKQRRRP